MASLTPRPRVLSCMNTKAPWGTLTEQAASRHHLVPAHALLHGGKCRRGAGDTHSRPAPPAPRGMGVGSSHRQAWPRTSLCARGTATGQAGVRWRGCVPLSLRLFQPSGAPAHNRSQAQTDVHRVWRFRATPFSKAGVPNRWAVDQCWSVDC